MTLPIYRILPALKAQLERDTTVILQADPGAGKSTVVPLQLLDSAWLHGKKILLLEPRRLAARSVASRLAASLDEPVGKTVGFRMRLERKTTRQTRIEVITEGMLTRQLQSDPELSGVGCIIFDEFHERSLQGDLGLALARDVQQSLREDLRLLIMSATLDSKALARLLDNAPIIQCQGRQFPVETYYLPRPEEAPSATRIAHVIVQALQTHDGNMLVFLPGIGEIRAVAAALEQQVDNQYLIAPLYGGLALQQQQLAIEPPSLHQRKIVLSTSIAETSLTIEGISLLVDAGLERRSEMNPRTGMASLTTVTASLASADQRRGRAGRLGPGYCYRLWAKQENPLRPAFSVPEIAITDLAPLVLEIAQWGVADPDDLSWLTPPPAKTWAQATRLLQSLEIIDQQHRLTHHGRTAAKLGLHPRLGHMLVVANRLGAGKLACGIAAFLIERSPFPKHHQEIDFSNRLPLLDASGPTPGVHQGILSRVRKQSRVYQRQLELLTASGHLSVGAICALAFPDRIAQARAANGLDYRLSGGGAAAFAMPNALSGTPWLVVTELDGRTREARIFSAVRISLSELESLFASRLLRKNRLRWDRQQQAIVSEEVTLLGELILRQKAAPIASEDAAIDLMLEAIRKQGLDCLPWKADVSDWLERLRFLHPIQGTQTTLPDFSETSLLETLASWLGPWLTDITRLAQLENLDLKAILLSQLTWEQQQRLDQLAPTHLTVPSGSRIRLRYQGAQPPVLAVRIQEMFSCNETPTIANGQVQVQLQLLSPAHRPVQITNDLAGFWRGSYQEVKKEMKGRYPKHHWPDDPVNTPAHATVKPRA